MVHPAMFNSVGMKAQLQNRILLDDPNMSSDIKRKEEMSWQS